jgi:uncharacterized protein (TIGR02302 family)
MQIRFSAQDDYGVVSGRAVITVALDQVDRRYGLAADPDPRDPLVLDLPLPFNGSRDAFEQILQDDISQHPFANLPVHIALEVTDDAGNIGTSGHDIARLAGRRFFDPLANAVIELRRDMLWSSANIARSAQILRALTHIPEDDLSNGLNFALDDVIKQLESETPLSANQIDDIAVVLWTVALELEEGPTDDALERLRQAQERLNEAMQQGASQAEIDELMREMRRAMDDYLRELAENAAPPEDMTDQPQSPDDRMYMSMTDLQDMLRQIEDLMQQGRIAEAQQMMQALQDLLENMEMTQTNEPGQGDFPGQQSLENLQDTLRDQQQLSEDAFQDLQDQFGQGQNQGQPNPNQGRDQGNDQDGDQGGDQEGGQTLADRQQALREELENQIGELPGTGTQAGDQALEQLDQAGRAMQQAEDLLQQGDIAGALDQQSRAMDALRDGMTALDQALTDDRFGEAGQGDTARGAFSDADTALDPLGRRAGETASGSIDNQAGTVLPQDGRQTAQDLIEELRRRSGDQTRPQIELDYLRRLLDDF